MANHPTSKNETPGVPVGSKKHNPRDNDKGPHQAHRHSDRKDGNGDSESERIAKAKNADDEE